jgi:hypothetical protein
MANKQMSIDQFLTRAEIEQAWEMYRTNTSSSFASRVATYIITPNMERINAALGQENNAMYLAYCVEYTFNQIAKEQK